MNPRDSWHSVHLGFRGDIYSATADRVILEVAEPVVRRARELGWCRRFFFVRYTDGSGPHLRLRLFGNPRCLAGELRPAILESAAKARTETGEPLVRQVAEVPYEPETERYGGHHGLALAERHFHRASETAVELLQGMAPENRSSRLGKALLATLVMLHTLFSDARGSAARHMRWYGGNYLRLRIPDQEVRRTWLEIFEQSRERQSESLAPYVEAAWEALRSGGPLTPALDRYRSYLQAFGRDLWALAAGRRLVAGGFPLLGWDRCVEVLCPSYLHMMNNRLGISIEDECYLSVLIDSTLGSEARRRIA